jgi:hypothetical protein
MYELKRTIARAAFKDLLGQANHFLITILIGLNGVRSGLVGHDPEFHAAWNPRDVVASADRSRVFALDLALVRAVDALDTYMMTSRRSPSTLGSAAFESQMDGTGRSVLKRLNVFFDHIQTVPSAHVSFLRLAIAWRNKKVHSLSDEELEAEDEQELLQSASSLADEFRGLAAKEVLRRFKAGESPQFKDAASVVSLAHKVVENFDQYLLGTLDIDNYIRVALRLSLGVSSTRSETIQIKHAAHRIWGDCDARKVKAVRMLRFIGVHPVEQVTARRVPDELIERVLNFELDAAIEYLRRDNI